LSTGASSLGKLGKTTIATLLMLVVWRIVTLKAVWVAAGERGDRTLTAILLFVSLVGNLVGLDLFLDV